MDWEEEEVLRLIEGYKKRPVLWNLDHRYHYYRIKRKDSLLELSNEMGKRTPAECKRKWEILLSAFRREKMKMAKIESEKEGEGEGEGDYTSSWFAFEAMRFLLDKEKDEDKAKNYLNDMNKTDIEVNSLSGIIEAEMDNTSSKKDDSETGFYIYESEEERDEREGQEIVNEKTENKHEKKGKTRSKKKKKNEENGNLDTTFSLLTSSMASKIDEECQIFGNLVAIKLRRYDHLTRLLIQIAILQKFKNADNGVYSDNSSTIQSVREKYNFSQPKFQLPSTQNSHKNNTYTFESIIPANSLHTMDQLSIVSSYSYRSTSPIETSSDIDQTEARKMLESAANEQILFIDPA